MEESCFTEALSSLSTLIQEYNHLDATKSIPVQDLPRLSIAIWRIKTGQEMMEQLLCVWGPQLWSPPYPHALSTAINGPKEFFFLISFWFFCHLTFISAFLWFRKLSLCGWLVFWVILFFFGMLTEFLSKNSIFYLITVCYCYIKLVMS